VKSHQPFKADLKRFSAAASEVLLSERANGRTTSASAFAYLIKGEGARAAAIFANHTKSNASAEAFSDYAAALLVSSASEDDPQLSIDALSACDHALAIDPRLAEARFNRALALRNLGLFAEARQAFLAVASVDRSPWAAEASRRAMDLGRLDGAAVCANALKSLSVVASSDDLQRLVAECPQQSRAYAETVWPGEWADAATHGDAKRAAEILDLTARVARQVRLTSGEALADDAAAVIKGHSPRQSASLAAAYLAYRAGRISHSKHNSTAAEPALRRAAELFRAANSPMQYVARYYVGSALFDQFRLAETARQLDALAATPLQQRGYRALDAQIGWERGAAAAMRGAFSDAFDIYAHSRETAASLGETDLLASFDGLIAGAQEFTGQPLQAWRVRRQALQNLSHLGNSSRVYVMLENAAAACAQRHEWHRALALLRLTTSAAEAAHNEVVAAHAYSQQASAHARLAETKSALDNLRHARQWIALMRDQRERDRASGDASFAEALILSDSNPRAALVQIEAAQRFSESAGDHLQVPREQLQNARIRLRLDDRPAARREVELGLAEIERQRAGIRDFEQRADMFSTADELFEEAMALALLDGDDSGAFRLAERQRSRTLLDTFASGGRSGPVPDRAPLTIEEIRSSLAPDAAIVEYVVAPQSLITFVIRPDGLTRTTVLIGRRDLDALVDDFRRSVAGSDSTGALRTAQRLADVLIRPIRSRLAGARQIAFIPDRSLGALSFAMLPDGPSLLVANAVVMQTGSATLAIECSRRAQSRTANSFFAVGASVVDRDRYGDLPFLPAVEREARQAATAHRGTETAMLLGRDATPGAVLGALPRFGISHFAAHAVASRRSPLDSCILLAPEVNGSHGELRAGDIAAASLPKTRLVVLAGCGTAAATEQRDGVNNLASAFLEAGVPTVVAMMWDAEDQTTLAVVTNFHRRLRISGIAEALCAATRDVLRTHPSIDALKLGGPAVIGGSAAFVRPSVPTIHVAREHRKEREP